eukprot:6175340-Pleurochrysis_carterae.AAC.1
MPPEYTSLTGPATCAKGMHQQGESSIYCAGCNALKVQGVGHISCVRVFMATPRARKTGAEARLA